MTPLVMSGAGTPACRSAGEGARATNDSRGRLSHFTNGVEMHPLPHGARGRGSWESARARQTACAHALTIFRLKTKRAR